MKEYKNYFVTMTPLGPFFFGGKKRSKEAEKEKDYYLKSCYFPQQTALLGMLRQELLIQNGLFPLPLKNQVEASKLIGEKSFDPEAITQDFGAIEGLSPLFIYKDGIAYFQFPRDLNKNLKESKGNSFINLSGNETNDFIPKLEDYKSKDWVHDCLFSGGNGERKGYEKVFIKNEQVGIKKGESGQTEKEAYYKQVFLQLKKGYSFAFYLRLKTAINGENVKLQDNMVFMGGERSAFKLALKEVPEPDSENSLQQLFAKNLPSCRGEKIVLFSDAYVKNQIFNLCRFAFTGSVFFRNIRTHVGRTEKYYNLTIVDKEKYKIPYLGHRLNLVERGSVLYAKKDALDQVKKCLDNRQFQKIGYNFYKCYSSKPGEEKER